MSVRGTFTSLSIGRNSLLAHRTAIDTVGHNLANAGVEGYTRQRATYSPMTATTTYGVGIQGNGVRIDSIQRMGQQLVERRLDQDASDSAEAESRLNFLNQLQVVYTDESWGVSDGINNFFNAFRELARNPASIVQRQEVLNAGAEMARRMNTAAARIEELRSDSDTQLKGYAGQVTQMASVIADLNREIRAIEANGGSANDLRDQRGVALRRIAELVEVRTHNDEDGHLIVQMTSGHTLVSGRRSATLETRPDPNNSGLAGIVYTDADGAKTVDITAGITSGAVGGVLNARDTAAAAALSGLDDLAFAIEQEVNLQHRAGFGLSIGGAAPANNANFFTILPGASGAASALAVDPALMADPRRLAAAETAAGSPGDNRNALELGAIEGRVILSNSSASDYWADQVRQVGDRVFRAERDMTNFDARKEQTTQVRESIAGVSVDEELAELVKVQTSFEASAKIISTADELLQTVLEIKR